MATSGTKLFNMDIAEMVEEATERVGGSPISGDEAGAARRSLNLLLTHLVNKNAPLNSQEERSFTGLEDQISYTLENDIINIRNAVVLDPVNGREMELNREDIQEYNTSYIKTQKGRPTTYFIERTTNGLIMKLWPKPDQTYTIRMWVTVKLEDVSKAAETIDIPTTYLPAICSGLAYYISLKRRGVDPNYRNELKALFAEELDAALKEDRLRTDMRIVPGRN